MKRGNLLTEEFHPVGGLFECRSCAALVTEAGRDIHSDWHDRNDR